MTTIATVKANHGWPVKVTQVKPGTLEPNGTFWDIPAGEQRDCVAHSHADLLIHEVQPSEAAQQPAADTAEPAATAE